MGGGLAFDDPAKVLAALNSAIDASNAAATEGPPVASLVTPTESFAGFFKIKETTNAAYFQANMEGEVAGMPVRGNAGVRWLHTSLSSTGNNIANGEVTGQTVDNSPYNFPLPRVNLVLEPPRRLLPRARIARAIRRPHLSPPHHP